MTTATAYELPPDIPRSDYREAAQVLAQAFTADPVWQELKPAGPSAQPRRCIGSFAARSPSPPPPAATSKPSATARAPSLRRPSPYAHRPGFPLWTILLRIPAMFLLGFTSTVRAARMAFAAEAHQPDGPHFYAYYAGSRDVGGGAALMKRLMKAGQRDSCPSTARPSRRTCSKSCASCVGTSPNRSISDTGAL